MVNNLPKIKVNFWLLGILAVVVLLRIPSFFEPHWYGDEEIYLVLGQMMRRGAILYRDIWDNKTPLLYFLYSLSPTLLWAKLSATIFVLATTMGMYKLAGKIFEDRTTAYTIVPTALVGILLSVPILEGNIANAELYFTLPIILGAALVYKLPTTDFRLPTTAWIGILAAIAFLLKVPAVLDFVGLLAGVLIIEICDEFWSTTRNYKNFLVRQIKIYLPIVVAFWTPVALVFVYFYLNHGLQDFMIAAFSQNANYVAIDSGPFSKLTNPLFVKGVVLLLGVVAVAMVYWRRLVAREFVLLSLWFGFSTYGALLSNRPYPHYLLQIVMPFILFFVYMMTNAKRYFVGLVVLGLVVVWAVRIFGAQFYFLGNLFKSGEIPYYSNFFDWASERKPWEDYVNDFDKNTLKYYKVAGLIKEDTNENGPIFVWGDIAAIYDLAERPAATKFIQAHHLTTIDPKNYDLIIQRLLKYQPKYIVVSRPVQFSFPLLEMLLSQNYKHVQTVAQIYIYKNKVLASPEKWTPNY